MRRSATVFFCAAVCQSHEALTEHVRDAFSCVAHQGYDALRMFELSEEFFVSLGLIPMPELFWEDSMIVRPVDRGVVCHASAWDFLNQVDFR